MKKEERYITIMKKTKMKNQEIQDNINKGIWEYEDNEKGWNEFEKNWGGIRNKEELQKIWKRTKTYKYNEKKYKYFVFYS